MLRSLRNKSTHAQKHSLNITDVLLKVYSRFSQVSPSKSSVHLHENESRPVIVHVPPFLQGCDLQGLTKETKHYIGRVEVRYDWQISRLYVQEISKMIIFIMPVPFSQDSP